MPKKIDSQGLLDSAEFALSCATQRGATAAELTLSADVGFTVNARMGDVETIEYHRNKDLLVNVYFDHRLGSVSTSDLSPSAIKKAIEKACSIANFTQEDSYAGIADKQYLAFDYPDLDLYHPWAVNPQDAIELAVTCEKLARDKDHRIVNSEGVSVTSYETFNVHANSNGFMGSYPTTRHSISCELVAEESGIMQRDYEYTSARDADDLLSIEKLATDAAIKTVQRLGARKISTRKCPVLFAPRLAKGLVGTFIRAISGRALYRKSTFLLDSFERQVFAKHISLDEHPHLKKMNGSAPFDSDGVVTRAHDVVRDGVLKSYVLSTYSARRLNLTPTGNAGGVHNLFVSYGTDDFDALVKKMGTGLIVTELIGRGVNLVTGDYSRGAFGFWVENGEVQYPVHEITIAGNLKDIFLNLVAVGCDVDHRSAIHTGSILVEEMTVAGE